MSPLRDLGIALSLANLCFYGEWAQLLPGSPKHYFLKTPPTPAAFAALVVNIAATAALLWVGARLARASRSRTVKLLARYGFLAAVAVAANGIRLQIPGLGIAGISALLGRSGMLAAGAASALIGAVVLARWGRQAANAAAALILVCAPFVLVTFGRAASALIDYNDAFATFRERPRAEPITTGRRKANRVVWMIFDELDQRLTFEDRPDGVDMPELDRFRAQALVATHAYPPAGQTLVSMPALLTGKLIAKARPVTANEIRMTMAENGRESHWDSEPNLFAEARAAGLNAAAVGWYHPYCRVFDSLLRCAWYEWKNAAGGGFAEQLGLQVVRTLQTIPGVRRLRPLRAVDLLGQGRGSDRYRRFAVDRYRGSLKAAQDVLDDPSVDLVLLHWPIPHPPGVFDRYKGELTEGVAGDPGSARRVNYLDNLALVDRTFAAVRRHLEQSGTWDATTILVSADHGYRTTLWGPKLHATDEERTVVGGRLDYRVPFLLKLANEGGAAVTFDAEINTLVTHDLILAVLRGELASTAAVVQWLSEHRSLGPSPYMKEWD